MSTKRLWWWDDDHRSLSRIAKTTNNYLSMFCHKLSIKCVKCVPFFGAFVWTVNVRDLAFRSCLSLVDTRVVSPKQITELFFTMTPSLAPLRALSIPPIQTVYTETYPANPHPTTSSSWTANWTCRCRRRRRCWRWDESRLIAFWQIARVDKNNDFLRSRKIDVAVHRNKKVNARSVHAGIRAVSKSRKKER